MQILQSSRTTILVGSNSKERRAPSQAASMQGFSDDGMMQCPYDKSHYILLKRFQVHLSRCRRNHKNVGKVICPFNTTHILNKPELDWHVSTCINRQSFENFKHRDGPTIPSTVAPTQPTADEMSENWDDDADVPSYNPQSYVAEAPVLRNLHGAPPSEKKQFRKEERLRHLALNNK